ncbi:MAG: hypothetical protein ACRDL7_03410, partial [Gaiellaceae bacterium]
MKQFQFATKGLDKVYTGDGKDFYTLSIFGKMVKKHLTNAGLDSVFYFVDPIDKEEKLIIEHYSRFTTDFILAKTQRMTDEYDRVNLQWSADFIMASLSEQQKCNILKFPNAENNGPVTWMHLVNENTMSNERALQTLLFNLQRMTLSDFPGENVQACTRQILEICQKLDAGTMLPTSIKSIICNIFTTCSVPSFGHYFHYVRAQMKKTPAEYTWGSLLQEADNEYIESITANRWLNTKSEASGLSAMAATELKPKGDDKKRDVTCYNCNEKGHVSRNCPKKKKDGSTKKSGKKPLPAWRTVPPNSGQAEQKTVNGHTFYWCNLCKKWWTLHGTSTHIQKPGQQGVTGIQSHQAEVNT